ncbi:MAG: protease complex subunit PrcB family protein [Gemmatimonadales bacterium]|nr:protease complex subunit PrcB family protein [Gemmatimonadales bacterium]NIP07400.1 protease complex subunit PrcB family protein [Gemmatimonadales bacterium]NIQ99097.1 protease complex subunit PrcB family protein [Gemmatimonadales bacterium]
MAQQPVSDSAISFQRIFHAPFSGIEQRRRVVIRSATELKTFWIEVAGPRMPPPELPLVDFSESLVIAVAMGRRGTGGHDIRVDQVYRAGERIVVVVREISPGPSCMVTMGLTAPIDIVRIPRSEDPVTFAENAETQECG